MRILVNYDSSEQNYLPVLQYFIKRVGLEAIATSQALSIGELVAKAQTSKCDAIFLINSKTLTNCVPGTSPTLDDWRGSLLSFSIPCIVGNSLAHTQTVPYGSWLLEKDLQRFNKPLVKQELAFTVLDTTDKFFDAFNVLKTAELLSYDIETRTINVYEEKCLAGDTIITCCAWTAVFADLSTKTYVLPMVDYTGDHWTTDTDYGRALSFLRGVNALDIPKVMHNGMYDCTHSIVYRAFPENWVLDTMAMTHSEFSELPKDLSFVASITLPDYCQWKSEASEASKAGDINRYWAYNAKDTYTTAMICLHYLTKLPAYAKKNYKDQFKLVYPALYCSFEGILIDNTKRLELRAEESVRLDSNLATLRVMLSDPDFNPSSYKQVGMYVYDILGAVDPKVGSKKNADGKKVKMDRGTNEKNLSAVGIQHPILLMVTSSIISYREARKAISTYMDFLQKESRLLYSLNPFGTESGRMSCKSSSFWCGTQVQNIPYYAKDMLIADEGFTLAEIDNSQSEARCTAYLAKDLKLIEALEDPTKDFYTSLGTLFFNIPYEKVTKPFRNLILKKIVHGTNYMMGAQTFIDNAGTQNLIDATTSLGVKLSLLPKPPTGTISLKQFAQNLLDSYHIPFFRVKQWYQEVKNEITATKKLVSPLGHTRYFFSDVSKNHQAFNSAVAHAPQNLSVSILNIGLWKVWGLVKKHKGNLRLKAQVHDSLLVQFKTDKPEILVEVTEAMQNPVRIHNKLMYIPTGGKVGSSWGTMKDTE